MSVLTVAVRPQEFALLAADGVSTDPRTGAVHQYLEKIKIYPSLSCAIGVTGMGKLDTMIDLFMPESVQEFDHLVEFLPGMVRYAQNQMIESGRLMCDDIRSNVVAAGWSSRAQEFKAYRVLTYPKGSQNAETGETVTLEPWVAHEMQPYGTWTSSAPHPEAWESCGLDQERDGEDEGATLTRIVCAGRQSSGKIFQDEADYPYNAGGFVQLALVNQGHCRTWITHRWPEDVIGEPIDPTRGVILPAHLTEDEG
ncbi:hypothetical protein C6W92_06035 [Roseovarius sp. A46]|uniref:hypothetical protein n=1 Tax=Roseovarius sp. A46 TaxID=2109331 RepID=UPI0010120C6C|nr:hypothetical protein [Roseovarius sp. A46]RXV64857.1 hypothetical protein C6W92_06035 [Roseovarius sp. A46]